MIAEPNLSPAAERLGCERIRRLLARSLPPAPDSLAVEGLREDIQNWLLDQGYTLDALAEAEPESVAAVLSSGIQPDYSEALRVLRPGGLFFALVDNRMAELLTALWQPACRPAVLADSLEELTDEGPPAGHDLRAEARAAGLVQTDLVAVEGAAWLHPGLSELLDRESTGLFELLERCEREPEIRGMSRQVLLTGFRPA